MSVQKIDKNRFDEIKNGERAVLLDFYADWCGPCRMIAPVIEEIAEERQDIIVGKVNVDSEASLAQLFCVVSIPTLIVLKDGRVYDKIVGARPKQDILDMLDGV